MSGETIEIAEIQETDFGEKAVIESPFEAKDYIKMLPWKEYADEISEHGSLRKKAESRGTNTKTSELMDVFGAMEEYGFSDDFATHVSWDNNQKAWTIDVDAIDEAADFWQFAGFTVEISDKVKKARS